MDVDGLRKELEEHLMKNPDENAPSGFRDRFEMVFEQLSADDGVPDEVREAQLQRIRDEAEAAHKCAGDQSDVPDNEFQTEPAGGGDSPPVEEGSDDREAAHPPTADPGGGVSDAEGQASAGFLQRFGLPLGVVVIALAAAYFLFRG